MKATTKMRAIIYKKYGGPEVLELGQVDIPMPKDKEILIRIFATAANSGDIRIRSADPWAVRLFFGLTKPKNPILGSVLSGEIVALGKAVTLFKVGDKVFGSTGMRFGSYAEYICLPENGILSIKPDNISHEEAGTVPFGGTTALHFVRKAKISTNQKVLIYGASGAVGTAAIQLAKNLGAEVTAVCSTSNMELVKSLGADKVIDYTKEDFRKNGETYDVIYETVNKLSYAESVKSLTKQGTLILGASGLSHMLKGAWTTMVSRRKVITGVISQKAEDMIFLKDLIERGVYKSIIDKAYPLEQMAAAHQYVEFGHKRGNVAIIVAA
ncbi:MAG: NAD(P)-dependent alcohol dehydrogenase [Chitinophagaceae bacterium]